MRRFVAHLVLLLPTLIIGCGSAAVGGVDAGPPDMARRIVNLSGTRSGTGNACTIPSDATPKGTCQSEIATCYTDGQHGFKDGYCSQDCGRLPCPSDAECVSISSDVNLCFALCNTDSDCRDGYVCTDYNACVPALGFYPGDSIVPGTNAGMACDPAAQVPSQAFAANQQLSIINGAQTAIAVDHTGANVLVVWVNLYDTQTLMYSSSQYGGALSGGLPTFSAPYPLPPDTSVDNTTTQSDPAAAVDSTGAFYVVWTGSGNDPDNVFVATSSDGLNFDVSVVSPPGESGLDTLSKPSIAIGADDTIYVGWTTTISDMGSRVVRVVSSADGGMTWSDPVTVTPDDSIDHENARVAVSSDGTVYATWVEVNGDPHGDKANHIGLAALAADLTPVGVPKVISQANDTPALDVPSISVDGTRVYVAYTSGSPEGQWDVMLAYSFDGGVTVKPSVKVNGDARCATHFHPTTALDGNHVLHVAYYDNRNLDGGVREATAKGTGTGAAVVLSFPSEELVSDMPFPFSTEAGSFNWLGDYLGMAIVGQNIYLGWADTRTRDTAQIQFSRTGL
jgi:hypothetical protein